MSLDRRCPRARSRRAFVCQQPPSFPCPIAPPNRCSSVPPFPPSHGGWPWTWLAGLWVASPGHPSRKPLRPTQGRSRYAVRVLRWPCTWPSCRVLSNGRRQSIHQPPPETVVIDKAGTVESAGGCLVARDVGTSHINGDGSSAACAGVRAGQMAVAVSGMAGSGRVPEHLRAGTHSLCQSQRHRRRSVFFPGVPARLMLA